MDEPEKVIGSRGECVLPRVAQVIRTTFKNPQLNITRETTADQVPGWDSLSHAVLLMHVERAFDIHLEPPDVVCLENVGELVDAIATILAR